MSDLHNNGYRIVSHEFDGFVVDGQIPVAAVLDNAKAKTGVRYAYLREKPDFGIGGS
jgi:hypothetical protein